MIPTESCGAEVKITTEECLELLFVEPKEGARLEAVMALTDFAKKRWADYQVLAAFAWQGIAGVLEVTNEHVQDFVSPPKARGVGPKRKAKHVDAALTKLNVELKSGAYADLWAEGAERYADAVLRFDEFLLDGGYRAREDRDAYTLYWGHGSASNQTEDHT